MEYQDEAHPIAAIRMIEGQARGVQRMISEGQDCELVVRQISAVRGALDRLNHRLIATNFESCLGSVEMAPEVQPRVERGLQALVEIRA